MTRRVSLSFECLAPPFLVLAGLPRCGSGGSPSATSGGGAATILSVLPEAVQIAVGDRGFVFAEAAVSINSLPQDVTTATRWQSSNPGVASVEGSTILVHSPGEADLRA